MFTEVEGIIRRQINVSAYATKLLLLFMIIHSKKVHV